MRKPIRLMAGEFLTRKLATPALAWLLTAPWDAGKRKLMKCRSGDRRRACAACGCSRSQELFVLRPDSGGW